MLQKSCNKSSYSPGLSCDEFDPKKKVSDLWHSRASRDFLPDVSKSWDCLDSIGVLQLDFLTLFTRVAFITWWSQKVHTFLLPSWMTKNSSSTFQQSFLKALSGHGQIHAPISVTKDVFPGLSRSGCVFPSQVKGTSQTLLAASWVIAFPPPSLTMSLSTMQS